MEDPYIKRILDYLGKDFIEDIFQTIQVTIRQKELLVVEYERKQNIMSTIQHFQPNSPKVRAISICYPDLIFEDGVDLGYLKMHILVGLKYYRRTKANGENPETHQIKLKL